MLSIELVIQSHLSDALIEMSSDPQMAELRIRFVKFLIGKYPNLKLKVSDEQLDDLWTEFQLPF